MNALRIAFDSVPELAAQTFRSMLQVLAGRTRCAWQLAESIDDADVAVVGYPGATFAQGKAKATIAIVDAAIGAARPQTPYVLTHPFRVMQVLTLLDEIAGELRQPEMRLAPNAAAGRWAFAESVRALAAANASAPWFRTRTAQGAEIIVTGNLHNFACEATLFDQIRGHATALAPLEEANVASVPAHYVRHPLVELLWFNAYHADTSLAPWLAGRGSFHILRWPDFGTLPATRQHLQMVALLAKHSCSRAQLAQVADAPLADVDRLLNALSLCDLLVHESAAPLARARAAAPLPSFMRALIGNLRRSLRLAY